MGLTYSDGIAAARTLLDVEGNAALQRRLRDTVGNWRPIPETICVEPRCAARIC